VATSLEAGKRLKFSNSSQFRSKLLLRLSEFVNARALHRTNRRIGSPGLAELPQIWSSGHSSVLKKLTILPALHSFLTDRWQQVEKLCQSALELGESQRRAFVELALGAVSLGWVRFQVMRRPHLSLMNDSRVDPKIVGTNWGIR